MIHIWHEDNCNSSTDQFWNFMKRNSKYTTRNLLSADIQGFNGNKALLEKVEQTKYNKNDTYYIFMDYVIDNKFALDYYNQAKEVTKNYSNVKLMKLLCFEYMMLSFTNFEVWTKKMQPNSLYAILIKARESFIECIENSINWYRSEDIIKALHMTGKIDTSKYGWKREITFLSSENIATWLLSSLTSGGTNRFEVSKTTLGTCWITDCCSLKYTSSFGNKKCNIYKYKKTSEIKAKNLWNNTKAHTYIK